MNIILGTDNADQLRDRFTVLELETFDVAGSTTTAYCVITAEDVNLGDMSVLEESKELHSKFVSAYNSKNYDIVKELGAELIGKFNGHVDSFYEIILDRIK